MGAYLLAVVVVRGVERSPGAMVAYVVACAYATASWFVLRWVWRSYGEARRTAQPPVEPTEPAARAPHRGLSGRDVPPTRW